MLLPWGTGKGRVSRGLKLLLEVANAVQCGPARRPAGGYRDLVGGLGEEVACPGEREPRIPKFPSTGVRVKMEPFPVFSRQLSPLLSSTLKPSEDPLCLYTQFRLLFLLF